MVDALLLRGADANVCNQHGKHALDYYKEAWNEADLTYHYGVSKQSTRLEHVCDWTGEYQGTQKKDLSAMRWFMPHVMVGMKLGEKEQVKLTGTMRMEIFNQPYTRTVKKSDTLYSLAKYHCDSRQPVVDARLYTLFAETLTTWRNQQPVIKELVQQLQYQPSPSPQKHDAAAPA